MKKVHIENNGAPIINDYVSIAQEAILEGLNKSFGSLGENLIITGCAVSISGSTVSITAGWAYWNGEVLRVPAHSWTDVAGFATNSIAYIVVETTNNPINYANGNTYNLTRENVLKFKAKTSETTFTYLLNFHTVGRSLGDKVELEAWKTVGTSGNGTFGSGWSENSLYNNERVAFRKSISGKIELKGACTIGVYADGLVLTLPAGYRPAYKRGFAITYTTGDSSSEMLGNATITILPNGQVKVIDCPVSVTVTVYFDGVCFAL